MDFNPSSGMVIFMTSFPHTHVHLSVSAVENLEPHALTYVLKYCHTESAGWLVCWLAQLAPHYDCY